MECALVGECVFTPPSLPLCWVGDKRITDRLRIPRLELFSAKAGAA